CGGGAAASPPSRARRAARRGGSPPLVRSGRRREGGAERLGGVEDPGAADDQVRDEACPAGLVAGAEAGTVVAVEVLVEGDELAPVRVLVEARGSALDGPAA